MRVDPLQIDIDASGSGNYPTATSGRPAAVAMDQMFGFSLIINGLTGQQGTLKVQVSNDSPNTLTQNPSAAVWADLSSGSFTINGAAVQTGNFDAQYYRWMRLSYARTGGTGTLSVLINQKGA